MPADEMVGAEMTEYTPDSIREVAEILAPQAGNYTNAITEQIGQAQQSMGPLAAATMGQSQTAGLGNYTYNRLVRPQVDVMRDELLVQGYTNALNKLLYNRLNAAKSAYGGGSSGGNGTTGSSGVNDSTTKEYTDQVSNNDDIEKKTDTVSTLPSTAKSNEQNVGTATVDGQTRIVTKESDGKYHIQGVGSYRSGSSAWNDAQKKYNVKLNPYPGSSFWTTF